MPDGFAHRGPLCLRICIVVRPRLVANRKIMDYQSVKLSFDFERGGSAGLVSGRVVLASFEEIGHFKAQVSGVGGIAQTGVELDDASANELLDFTIEMLHAFGAAIAHGIE